MESLQQGPSATVAAVFAAWLLWRIRDDGWSGDWADLGTAYGYEASLSSTSFKLSSPSILDQLVSFPFPLSEDTPSLHFTGSSSLPSTTVNAKDTTILPFIPAGRGERLPTNEIEDMVTSHSSTPNVEPSLVLLLRTELATTRALLASSKDANLALQERIKQLESSSSAELPRTKLPRDRLGRFVTKTTSVQKVQRLPLGTKTNSSRACRRTQNAMLVEAAIEYGYVNVPKGRIAVPGKLAVKENSVELYARESRDGEERENREKLWARSWCEDVHKRRVTKIQGMTERDQAGI